MAEVFDNGVVRLWAMSQLSLVEGMAYGILRSLWIPPGRTGTSEERGRFGVLKPVPGVCVNG
jgi:hypothetical protein